MTAPDSPAVEQRPTDQDGLRAEIEAWVWGRESVMLDFDTDNAEFRAAFLAGARLDIDALLAGPLAAVLARLDAAEDAAEQRGRAEVAAKVRELATGIARAGFDLGPMVVRLTVARHLRALADEADRGTRPDEATSRQDALRDALRVHHPIMRSETGPFSGCRCGQVRLGQDVIAHVVDHLRAALAAGAPEGGRR